MRQDRERFTLAVLVLQPRQESLTRWVETQKTDGCFRESPLQMGVADFGSGEAVGLAGGFLLRFDQTAVGCAILDARETVDVVNLVEQDQREDFADTGDGIQ